MVELYEINKEVKNKPIIICGCNSIGIGMMLLLEKQGFSQYVVGFISGTYKDNTFMGLPVINISLVDQLKGAHVIICEEHWIIYYDFLSKRDIITVSIGHLGWNNSSEECIICGNKNGMVEGRAMFSPFLVERIFNGHNQPTSIVHCPHCSFTYSKYRPNDEEMTRLYTGYRNEEYQKQRFKYDNYYTVEFNNNLSNPEDGGKLRRDAIVEFVKDMVNPTQCSNVLDFGGDMGQFIPEAFEKADKYVYEISGVNVIDGVKLLNEYDGLADYSWDFIMCNMVMEHLSDVNAYFENLVNIMNYDTFLYIEVPFEMYDISGNFALVHEHINMFRIRTFEILAQMYGAKVLKATDSDCIRVLLKKI